MRPNAVADQAVVATPLLYRFSSECSPLPTIATEGPSHILRHANPAFCRLFGCDRSHILGRPLVEALDGTACRYHILALLDRVHDCRGSQDFPELTHSGPDGEDTYWTCMAWPVFEGTDELVGVMLQMVDATEAVHARWRVEQADEQIRAVNEQLLIAGIREHEAAEHTATVQQHLHHVQRMEGIGKLAGGIAHDFNNLLTAILGYAKLASDRLPPDEPAQKYLRNIVGAGERAARLTGQLLAFARKQVVVPRVLDVNLLILETDSMLRHLLGEHIEFVRSLRSDPAWVTLDPGQFGQVLINLAVNARDAMPGGGILTIETSNVTLGAEYGRTHDGLVPGDYVQVSVNDTGTGMSADALEHLFEPFYTTKPPGMGTGLGLATTWGIVRQSSGHVDVESGPGAGTKVRIYLPCADASDLPATDAEAPALPDSAAGIPRAMETVLLVEDEALVRGIAAQALRLHGYTVLEAQDGKEALRVLRKHPGADLVVTDLVMPVMGGRELAERLRKTHPRLKVLFMSGYTDDGTVQRGIGNLGVGFLHKPFTPADLTGKVREALSGA